MFNTIHRHLTAALRGTKGVIDLASILVGVVIIGLIGAGILATVTMVIPFAQDEAAKSDLGAVTTAQAVALVQHETYYDYDGLVANDFIQESETIDITVGDGCYIAVSQSASGKAFYSSSKTAGVAEYSDSVDTSWCGEAPPEGPAANDASDFTWSTAGDEATVTGYIGTSLDVSIPATYTTAGTTYDVTSIGANAFAFGALTSVIIPDSVISIGDGAFSISSLTSVSIPDSVTTVGMNAFDASQLTSVTIGNGVTSIGNFAFQNNEIESVTFGSSVTEVGNYAFQNNTLESVVIPESVESIGHGTFKGNQLVSVTMGGDAPTIGADSPFGIDPTATFYYPAGATGYGVSPWSGFTTG